MADTNTRILIAKTGLDGHWRGASLVSKALRDAGFEVNLLGMAKPDEIAQAVLYLASDASSFMTGGVIDLNGGRFLR